MYTEFLGLPWKKGFSLTPASAPASVPDPRQNQSHPYLSLLIDRLFLSEHLPLLSELPEGQPEPVFHSAHGVKHMLTSAQESQMPERNQQRDRSDEQGQAWLGKYLLILTKLPGWLSPTSASGRCAEQKHNSSAISLI